MPLDPNDPNNYPPTLGASDSMRNPMGKTITPMNSGGGGVPIGAVIGLGVGCFLPVLVVGFFVFNAFFAADLFPNSIHGNFADGTIIPAGPNEGKAFLIMDDTFYFVSETSSPGSHKIGTESFFNKIYSYVYDAPGQKVLERTKTTFDATTPEFHLFDIGDSMWMVGTAFNEKKPYLKVTDMKTGTETLNLDGLIKKFDQLKSGVLEMRFVDDAKFYKYLTIKTVDGQNFEYYPDFDLLVNGSVDVKQWLLDNKYDDMIADTTGWVLDATTADREELYLIKGQKYNVMTAVADEREDGYVDSAFTEAYQKHNGGFTEPPESTSQKIGDNLVFLQGIILYQDSDVALILYQQDARDLSPKLISLVNKDKGLVWTATEDKLLPAMRTNPNDDFTSMFFIKDNFSAERIKDTMLLKFKQGGMMAFDIATGNVLWTFDPYKGWF